ncbi:MAG: SurA N-terminal domain-containing protein, partial [Nanoarchaeota archaeon]
MAKKIPRKKKSSPKKEDKKLFDAKKKKQYTTIILVSVIVIVVLLTAILLYANSVELNKNSPGFLKFFKKVTDTFSPKVKSEIAAVVNNEEITMEMVDAAYNSLPPDRKPFTDKKTVLDSLIEETLLLQEAERKGYSVSDEEVTNSLNALLLQNQLTLEQYASMLEQAGSSIEEAKNFYKKSFTINKL